MRRLLQSGAVSAVLLALSQVVPVSLSAGVFCNHGLFGCRGRNSCRCQALPRQPQFTMQPQVQATPVLTYKEVTRTEYRLQAQTVTVPVTTQQTVTVDEGGWQKVWVPRIVQKQIPTTTYQQQTVYNQVPYQVSQQIPQVTYQQRTTMVPRVTGHVRSSCNACGTGNTWTSHNHNHHAGIEAERLNQILNLNIAAGRHVSGAPDLLRDLHARVGPGRGIAAQRAGIEVFGDLRRFDLGFGLRLCLEIIALPPSL